MLICQNVYGKKKGKESMPLPNKNLPSQTNIGDLYVIINVLAKIMETYEEIIDKLHLI